MKPYKIIYFFLFLSFPVYLLGCTSLDMSKHLITMDHNYFESSATPKGMIKLAYSEDISFAKLEAAYRQVKGIPTKSSRIMKLSAMDQEPLPNFFAKDPLISKVIIATYESLVEFKMTSIKVTKIDVESINLMIARNFGAGASKKDEVEEDSKKKVFEITKKYLMVYYTDTENGFIDREGTIYKHPEFKGSIGNDVITALIGIVIESVFDGLLETPVYVDKDGKFQTKKGKEPTVYKLGFADKITIVPRSEEGIDDLELKAIRYLSGLAADQSKAVSGAVYRFFGDLEIGFIVGGHFSFGDNETLAKILDTTFEVASKRIVEEGSYKGFKRLTFNYKALPDIKEQTSALKLLIDLSKI